MGFLTPLRVILWGKPADTKAERRLVLKLDCVILSSCCLMYWVNYLDRANLNNAFVSGMKEELAMYSTELNVINTIFWCGYVLGQVPNNLAIQFLPPRIYMPCCMVAWGLLTLGTGFVHSSKSIMAIRFFQAIFEGSTFVGVHYLLGCWYKPDELGKRTGIFTSSGLAGTMFSGLIQGGVYSTLNGAKGLAGWRWMFIVDFLITLPIALYIYFMFPDTPSSTKAWYFNAEEKALAVSRMPEVEYKRGHLGKSTIKRVFASWEIYGFCFIWSMGSNCEMFSTNAILNIYLKYVGTYTVQQVNYIPTAVSGIAIVATLVLGWYTDFTKKSWHVGVLLSFTAIITAGIMLNPPSYGAKLFALFLNGCQYANQTVMFAWANRLTTNDDAKRSIILAMMNTIAVAIYAFWSICFYNTAQAPMWRDGSIAMLVAGSCMFIGTLGVHYMEVRMEKRGLLVFDGEGDSTGLGRTGTGSEVEKTEAGTVITPAKTATGVV